MNPAQQTSRRKHRTLLKRAKGDRPYRPLGLSKAILQILANRFVARTTDLYSLIPQTSGTREGHERIIRRALTTLRESTDPHEKKNDVDRQWGFIRSVSWSDPTIDNKIEYTCLVHGLTDRGLRLARDRGLDPDHIGRSFQEFSADHVDHEVRLNDFVDLLSAEVAKIGMELVVIRINLKRKHIHPDLLLYIYDPKTDTRSAPIFVEYEKQKRGQWDDGKPQVIRKLEALAGYYNSAECESDFGFKKFYVITILRTERKANFLLRDLADRDLKRKIFLVASEPLFKEQILATPYRTAAGAETHTILDL